MFDSLPNCFSDEFVLRASELLFYVVFNDNLHHYYNIQIFKFICIKEQKQFYIAKMYKIRANELNGENIL